MPQSEPIAAALLQAAPDATADRRALTPAAQRALAEAAERRTLAAAAAAAGTKPALPEVGGRGGLDPIRYGDWEKGGLASDF